MGFYCTKVTFSGMGQINLASFGKSRNKNILQNKNYFKIFKEIYFQKTLFFLKKSHFFRKNWQLFRIFKN